MSMVTPTPQDSRQAIIEQYKNYAKTITSQPNDLSVLLNAFANASGADSLFSSPSEKQNEIEDFFNRQAASVKINKDAVRSRLWDDLEEKVKLYEATHPDITGTYVVAINAGADADGKPAYTVTDAANVLDLVGENDRTSSAATITEHPVQVFSVANVNVRKLPEKDLAGIKEVVAEFMAHNQGVFKFLDGTAASAENPPAGAGNSLTTYLA